MLRSRPGAARTRRYRTAPTVLRCCIARGRGGAVVAARPGYRRASKVPAARDLDRSRMPHALRRARPAGRNRARPAAILARHGRDHRHRGRARLRNPTAHVRERSHPGPRCRHSAGVAHQDVGHEHGAAFLRCVLLSECADVGFSLGELSGLPRFGGGVRPLCGARPGLVLAARPIGMPAHSCDRRMPRHGGGRCVDRDLAERARIRIHRRAKCQCFIVLSDLARDRRSDRPRPAARSSGEHRLAAFCAAVGLRSPDGAATYPADPSGVAGATEPVPAARLRSRARSLLPVR